jgi:transketolase
LFGGSADLTWSNYTRWTDAPDERYLSFGVREFGMTAMTNGMLLHGGWRPFAGTFLVFMEYARNAVRLAALMKIPTYSSTPTTRWRSARTARPTSPWSS